MSCVCQGLLKGLSLGRIDQYARQVTVEMSKPFSLEKCFSVADLTSDAALLGAAPSASVLPMEAGRRVSGGGDGDGGEGNSISIPNTEGGDLMSLAFSYDAHDHQQHMTAEFGGALERERIPSLIIAFPPKFPSKGQPTFTVRNVYSNKVRRKEYCFLFLVHHMYPLRVYQNGSSEVRSIDSLVDELNEIAKSSLKDHSVYAPLSLSNSVATIASSSSVISLDIQSERGSASSGFLLDISRCFRNRVLQTWGLHAESSENKLIHATNFLAENSHEPSLRMVSAEEGGAGGDTLGGVIEPRAYLIPYPVSSGAIFSTSGHLSLFGGTIFASNI